jgi:hypothetical protein
MAWLIAGRTAARNVEADSSKKTSRQTVYEATLSSAAPSSLWTTTLSASLMAVAPCAALWRAVTGMARRRGSNARSGPPNRTRDAETPRHGARGALGQLVHTVSGFQSRQRSRLQVTFRESYPIPVSLRHARCSTDQARRPPGYARPYRSLPPPVDALVS